MGTLEQTSVDYSFELNAEGYWVNTSSYANDVVSADDKEGRLKYRSLIESYHAAMKDHVGNDRGDADIINENGLKEHFIEGAYIRELLIPKDTTMVSELWNKDRFWIIARGDVTITTETGTKRVKGPHTEIPAFGSRVALYTHEDTLWFAITGAVSTTPEDVKEELIVKDHSELTYPWDLIEDKGA